VEVEAAGVDLLDGSAHEGTVALEPGGVRVLRVSAGGA
jgi:hypothetical protein